METATWNETFVERRVNYVLEAGDTFIVIRNVPARVCVETGERLFFPETVERLQKMVWEQKQPNCRMEVPVFEYAA
jgi:YgiT-type zinc finger domain-containing protein